MVVYNNNNRQNIIEKYTCGGKEVKLGSVQYEQYLFVSRCRGRARLPDHILF